MIFRKIAEWITGHKRDDQKHILDKLNDRKVEERQAPYKVESPASAVETKPVETINTIAEPAKCGCGRSPTGLCVGLHKLTTEEWSAHADNPNRVVAAAPEVKAEEKPAKKPAAKKPKAEKPAAKKPKAEKPAAKKAPAKKPVAAKKAPAKKPATKKKADAVVQAPARKKVK